MMDTNTQSIIANTIVALAALAVIFFIIKRCFSKKTCGNNGCGCTKQKWFKKKSDSTFNDDQ